MDLEINKSPYVQSLTVPRRGNAIPTLEQNSRKYTVLSKIKPHALLMSKKKKKFNLRVLDRVYHIDELRPKFKASPQLHVQI